MPRWPVSRTGPLPAHPPPGWSLQLLGVPVTGPGWSPVYLGAGFSGIAASSSKAQAWGEWGPAREVTPLFVHPGFQVSTQHPPCSQAGGQTASSSLIRIHRPPTLGQPQPETLWSQHLQAEMLFGLPESEAVALPQGVPSSQGSSVQTSGPLKPGRSGFEFQLDH